MGDEGASAAGTAAAGSVASPLERLLALQDLDIHRDQLAHRRRNLPEQAALDAVVASIGALERATSGAREARDALAAREAELERETAEVVRRVATIEERARSAAASSFRDQEAMAAEVAALGRRRDELETHELEVLEEREPLDAELRLADASRGELEAELAAARLALEASAASLDAEIASAAARRDELAAVVPGELLAQYERLRAKLGGVGVARLVRGVCEGCHLALPATEVDRLRHLAAGAVEHCEQCGRILVP